MTAHRLLLAALPAVIMLAATILTPGFEHRLAALGTSAQAKLTLGRAGLALPFVASATIGVVALLAINGSANIKVAGLSVLAGSAAVIVIGITRETIHLAVSGLMRRANGANPHRGFLSRRSAIRRQQSTYSCAAATQRSGSTRQTALQGRRDRRAHAPGS
jgi:hypothetical protein